MRLFALGLILVLALGSPAVTPSTPSPDSVEKVKAETSDRVPESTIMLAVESSPNSFTNKDYGKTIQSKDSLEDLKVTSLIASERDNNRLYFGCLIKTKDGFTTSVGMYGQPDDSACVEMSFEGKKANLYSKTNINKGSYSKKKKLSWTFEDASDTSSELKDAKQELANRTFRICVEHWDSLLRSETGYNLSNWLC